MPRLTPGSALAASVTAPVMLAFLGLQMLYLPNFNGVNPNRGVLGTGNASFIVVEVNSTGLRF